MIVFDFTDYRKFLRTYIDHQPQQGRGLLRKWAKELRVHPTLLSQVLGEAKNLSLESAHKLCEVLGLSENETDFFLLLVLYSRAGNEKLRAKFGKKIESERKRSNAVHERLKVKDEISDEAKAVFYSSWIYSAIRNLASIKQFSSTEAIAERLGIPREFAQEAIEFLVKFGLCRYSDGKVKIGPARTHLPADSPYVLKHHQNWRNRSICQMDLRQPNDLFFTFPMTISSHDVQLIRSMITKLIEDTHKVVGPSNSEVLRCLNLDFFEV